MRKIIFPAILSATLLLGGCATGLGGNPIGGILGSILGGGLGSQNNLSEFERAGANACGREASRYGRVEITYAEQNSRDTVRVDGRIQTNDGRRGEFSCIFGSNGRIVDFRTY